MKLTEKQFKYIYLIDRELKKRFPAFLGFSGSKENVNVVGEISESLIKEEIDKIDLDALIPKPLDKKKTIQKLRQLGLDDDDIAVIGIKED